jgi:hypothetical protein
MAVEIHQLFPELNMQAFADCAFAMRNLRNPQISCIFLLFVAKQHQQAHPISQMRENGLK